MALFRQAVRVSAFARQCSRVVTTQHQQKRGYADMPLTLASPSDVVKENLMKARNDLTTASSDKDKAEAQITVDALEALDKALH
ncbi:hypothetical protein KUTeg_016489 [Tegillarca granosa]|uniref:F1F0-ATP synthase delta subunit C-terminal domain-containing protein n=1 Tax=Tegillarca granosa TaxID=220873 RepID=A0ABQ9EL02_TEGGR|nr:hypothetical protein KUTeg_016489 [Tegillarca granosa]